MGISRLLANLEEYFYLSDEISKHSDEDSLKELNLIKKNILNSINNLIDLRVESLLKNTENYNQLPDDKICISKEEAYSILEALKIPPTNNMFQTNQQDFIKQYKQWYSKDRFEAAKILAKKIIKI